MASSGNSSFSRPVNAVVTGDNRTSDEIHNLSQTGAEESLTNLSLDQSDSERQAIHLLQKLQDLRVWQARQEKILLEEQKRQVLLNVHNVDQTGVETDEDSLSSMEYDQEHHRTSWGQSNDDQIIKSPDMSEEVTSDDQLSFPSSPPSPVNPEDQVLGGTSRTFAQLLADKLGVQNQTDVSQEDEEKTKYPPAPRPFLRRGQGLTRYNLPPDPSLQPSQTRTGKKSPQCKEVASRLSQETLSFKNKKNVPYKSPVTKIRVDNDGNDSQVTRAKVDNDNIISKLTIESKVKTDSSPPARLKLNKPVVKPLRTQFQCGRMPRSSTSGCDLSQENGQLCRDDPRDNPPPMAAKISCHVGLSDSVENSFMEKLGIQEKRHRKDLKELAVFEMLEDAANDSSFCSNSSRVRTLVNHSILPSPSRHPEKFTSSTPAPNKSFIGPSISDSTPTMASHSLPSFTDNNPTKVSHSTPLNMNISSTLHTNDATSPNEDLSLGETLMEDIRKFLISNKNQQSKESQPTVNVTKKQEYLPEDSSDEWTDESDDTIHEDMEQTIGRDWKERMNNDEVKEDNKRMHDLLEYLPPDTLPKNSPSHLIWSIFTKEREERKNKMKNSSSQKNQEHSGRTAQQAVTKSASSGGGAQYKPSEKGTVAAPNDSNKDLDYQGTLLHMRVVELEQEIETFKKENNKINDIKKKLQNGKDKFSKELQEFEAMKETEKKKIEEEKKRNKRDKVFLDKQKKENSNQGKGCSSCGENKQKVEKLNSEIATKETKWAVTVNKLQEKVAKLDKEKLDLENENQKLRLKKVASKVKGTMKVDVINHRVDSRTSGEDEAPDSGFRTQPVSSVETAESETDTELLDTDQRRSISSSIYAALCVSEDDNKKLLPAFSPAESLESSMSLVSGGLTTTEGVTTTVNQERGTREKRFSDGRVEVWYSNGNRKEVSPDGSIVKVFYFNGDVKETQSSGLVRYLYSQTQTWHITHPDKREVLQFSNGQEETKFPDGSLAISFPDGSTKTISASGEETIKFPDGTLVTVLPSGDRLLHLPNGQTEEHTDMWKKRTYPDGTVKILHSDGRQETRYAGGRVRVKDSQGRLIQDTHPGAPANVARV